MGQGILGMLRNMSASSGVTIGMVRFESFHITRRISCRPIRVAMRPYQMHIEAVTTGFRDTFFAS